MRLHGSWTFTRYILTLSRTTVHPKLVRVVIPHILTHPHSRDYFSKFDDSKKTVKWTSRKYIHTDTEVSKCSF